MQNLESLLGYVEFESEGGGFWNLEFRVWLFLDLLIFRWKIGRGTTKFETIAKVTSDSE